MVMAGRRWAVHYTQLAQRRWNTLAERARIRSIFANGDPGPYVLWGTDYIPAYLHFSVLLFVAGCLIYFFNINRPVFYAVVWWVGINTILYAIYSVVGFFHQTLIHTPLSTLALSIYLGVSYVLFQICSHIPPLHNLHDNIKRVYCNLSCRYSDGFLVGKRTEAEETASKPSSEIDTWILRRILPTLDEDGALETFFDTLPGFCNSKLTVLPLSSSVQIKLRKTLDGFLDRTFSSNSVSESVRASRLITCLNAAHTALGSHKVSGILDNILNRHWDKALQSVEIGHALRLWGHGQEHETIVRLIVACVITRVRVRDDRWTLLVKETFGMPDRVFRDYLAHGDSLLLSILIRVSREASRARPFPSEILSSLSQFDIHNTLPRLQHDFCTLWNEISQEARNRWRFSTPAKILDEIHHLYIALHHDTHATPTSSSTSTDSLEQSFIQYSLCDIASHRLDSTNHNPVAISEAVSLPTQPRDLPDASPHPFTFEHSTALRQPEEENIITGLPSPPDPSTTSEIGGETSHSFTTTFPIYSCSPSPDRPPQDDVAAAQPGTTSAKLSYPLESNRQKGPALGLTTPYAAPPVENGSTLSTLPAPAPLPSSNPPVPNKSFTTYDASPDFITESSLPAPVPDPLSPPPVPPLPNAELPSLRGSMSLNDPPDNATLSRLQPCRLVDNGDMLTNAVLQMLVSCPPFRDLLRDARQAGQREGGVYGGRATSLIDASVRLLDEFAYEKSSVAHRFLGQAGGCKVREDEDGEKEDDGAHSFPSTDVFDAMKEKRQFIIMSVRSSARIMAFCH